MTIVPNITVVSDSATAEIERLMSRVEPLRLVEVCKGPLQEFTRVHLAANGRNKKGWPSTGFWEEASRHTLAVSQAGGVLIRVEKLGVRQRYYGGTIEPVNAKALAIPISPVSYGHQPKEFPGMFLLKTKKGAYLVMYGSEVSQKSGRMIGNKKLGGNIGSRRRASLLFLFKLVGSVTQQPDPSVIPTDDEFTEVAFSAIHRSLAE